MIKNSLKNFGKNLIYLFIPMGIVYLMILVALFAFVGAAANDVKIAFSDISALLGESMEQSSASLKEFASYALSQIDWNGTFPETLQEIADTNWLQNTLRGFAETLSGNTEGFEQSLAEICANFAKSIVNDLIAAGALCVLGLLAANLVTRIALRSKVAKRNLKQAVAAHTLVPLAETALLIASVLLLSFIKLYSLLVFAAFAVLMCIISLCTSFMIYRDNGLRLKEVLTAKSVLSHLASIGIILLINIAVAAALYFVNKLLAILLMIPVVIYSANIIDVNTDYYVRDMAMKKAPDRQSVSERG